MKKLIALMCVAVVAMGATSFNAEAKVKKTAVKKTEKVVKAKTDVKDAKPCEMKCEKAEGCKEEMKAEGVKAEMLNKNGLKKMELKDTKSADFKKVKACKDEANPDCCKKDGKECDKKAECGHKSPCCKEGACKMDGSCGKEKCEPGSEKCCK